VRFRGKAQVGGLAPEAGSFLMNKFWRVHETQKPNDDSNGVISAVINV